MSDKTAEALDETGTVSTTGGKRTSYGVLYRQCASYKCPRIDFILKDNKIEKRKQKLLPWSSWSRVLTSTGGELGRGTTFRGTPFDKRDSLSSDSSWAILN